MEAGPSITIGGDRVVRAYAVAAMSRRARPAPFGCRRPTWEKPYVSGHVRLNRGDPDRLVAEAGKPAPRGVVTADERLAESTVRVAGALGRPGIGSRHRGASRDAAGRSGHGRPYSGRAVT